MQRILLCMMILSFVVFKMKAQEDIVLANYEVGSSYPDRTTAWINDSLKLGIDNPVIDATNGSNKVASYHITTQWSDAVSVSNFDEPVSLGIRPFLKVKILTDSAVSTVVTATLIDIDNHSESVDITLPGDVNTAWTDAVFDFSGIAQSTSISLIKEVLLKFDYGKATDGTNQHNIYYFDDIRFTGPSLTVATSDVLTIFSETFAVNAWWISDPKETTLGDLRTAAWGGSALTAPAKHYVATDSIRMEGEYDQVGWTWAHGIAELYPNSIRPTIDHLEILKIAIGGYSNLALTYNFKWKDGQTVFTESPTVEYSVDGGAWTEVTTTTALPTNTSSWDTLSYNLSAVVGDTLKLRFTNNTTENFYLDDIFLKANPSFVTSIDVNTEDGTNAINIKGQTKQMVATVLPTTAKQKVAWSLINGTGKAILSETGEVTAIKNGKVKVIARALDLYGTVRDTQEVVLTHQVYPVTAISISGADTVKTDNGQANYTFNITPWDADTLTYMLSTVDSSGNTVTNATIAADGTLTAHKNGYVIIRAVANDYMHVSTEKTVILENQTFIPATSVTISGGNSISTPHGTLQLTTDFLPVDADIKLVEWSITNETGTATISDDGVVTALSNGTVTVRATYIDDNTIFDEVQITLSNQIVMTISSANTITTNNGTLDLTVDFDPTNLIDKNVTWSIVSDDADTATISGNTLTALRNGKVTVRATYDSNTSITDEMEITISNQLVELSSITVNGDDITTDNGSSQMSFTLNPIDADNVDIRWSLSSAVDSAKATISSTGLVEALRNGTITVVAMDNNSAIQGTKTISISGQIVLVSAIEITSAGNATGIDVGGTLQLTAVITPDDADDGSVTWSVSNESLASVSQTGLVTALAEGTVTVTATANDVSGVNATFDITISEQTLGIMSNHINKLEVYPNPTKNDLFIKIDEKEPVVEIISNSGLLVLKSRMNDSSKKLNVGSLQPGTYILRITTKDKLYQSIFIKE